MDNKDYLDFDEAVQYLKTTPSTLYKWLQSGKVPGHKLGRQWRFLRDELDLHISGQGTKIQVQKDFLNLWELLKNRNQKNQPQEETEMDLSHSSILQQLIWSAFDSGSRLIHLTPSKGKFQISYRTSAGLQALTTLQEDSFVKLDEALMGLSTAITDEKVRRLYLHRQDSESLQVRYQKLETVIGPRITLRLWQPEKDVLPLEKIVPKDNPHALAQFEKWTEQSRGIILITGATGSGKTTTTYSLLNAFKNRGRAVFTLEDTAALVIEGINQIEIKGRSAAVFEEAFEQIYGSDPDVICLGLGTYFGREESVFNCAFQAASTGHVVIIQMHEDSCEAALACMNKYLKYNAEHLILGVSCQKLVQVEGRLKAHYEFAPKLESRA